MKKTCRSYEQEKEDISDKLVSIGIPLEDAITVAECFATADLFGVTTHGKEILPAHIKRALSGGYNLKPQFKKIKETETFTVIDGDNAMGPVSGRFCMNYAINMAKKVGIYSVFSKNNNTFGPAFYYPLMAADEGMIGIAFSNSPAQMAPPGGKEKMLGTNPFSIVIPVKGDDPIILDMATSVVAKSKFVEYKKRGQKLPEGWAIDKEGQKTIDPDEAINGFVLPMAGYKGYGLSMMLDILAGVLSGAAYLNEVGRFYVEGNKSMNVGFCFIAIDPIQIMGEKYNDIIEDYVKKIRESENINGEIISLPGEDRIRYAREKIEKDEDSLDC